ncbi:MAG: GlxA family transcriptional regulator [Rhodobacteraceae bacterium]|nr:GlxA family transcriptional regulator [Paracoccaceae bacterium]
MKSEENIFRVEADSLAVGILLLADSNMLSLASCIDPMRAANRRADRQVFSWQLVSPEGGEVRLTSGIDIATDPLAARPDFDVLIVVAGFNLTRHTTPALLRRLREVAPRLRAIGGVDGGGWILARTGLLDGQTATTHWEDLEEFADVFPRINVVHDRFTISGKYFTTGGAAPAIDMMLHLIRSRHGPKLAESVASAFIYETVQGASAPQMPVSTARLQRTAPKAARAVELMGKSLGDPGSAAEIARAVGLSRRGLELLFQKELGRSPGAFFLGLRLQEARRMVLDTALPAQEIALRTGFTSQSVFARAFRREFGMSASDLRRLHRR